MSNIVGTPRKVTLDGNTFSVMADANFSQMKGKFVTEALATTGGNVMKKTLRPQTVEAVNLQCTGAEADTLRALSESAVNFPMSYETASGDVFRAVGQIDFESHDTDAGLAVIKMHPESVDGWAPFLS